MGDFTINIGNYYYVIDKNTLKVKERTSDWHVSYVDSMLPIKVGNTLFMYSTADNDLKVWFSGYEYVIESSCDSLIEFVYVNNRFCMEYIATFRNVQVCRVSNMLFITCFGILALIREGIFMY